MSSDQRIDSTVNSAQSPSLLNTAGEYLHALGERVGLLSPTSETMHTADPSLRSPLEEVSRDHLVNPTTSATTEGTRYHHDIPTGLVQSPETIDRIKQQHSSTSAMENAQVGMHNAKINTQNTWENVKDSAQTGMENVKEKAQAGWENAKDAMTPQTTTSGDLRIHRGENLLAADPVDDTVIERKFPTGGSTMTMNRAEAGMENVKDRAQTGLENAKLKAQSGLEYVKDTLNQPTTGDMRLHKNLIAADPVDDTVLERKNPASSMTMNRAEAGLENAKWNAQAGMENVMDRAQNGLENAKLKAQSGLEYVKDTLNQPTTGDMRLHKNENLIAADPVDDTVLERKNPGGSTMTMNRAEAGLENAKWNAQAGMENAKDNVQTGLHNAKVTAENTWETAKDKAQTGWENVKEAASTGWESAKDQAEIAKDNAARALDHEAAVTPIKEKDFAKYSWDTTQTGVLFDTTGVDSDLVKSKGSLLE